MKLEQLILTVDSENVLEEYSDKKQILLQQTKSLLLDLDKKAVQAQVLELTYSESLRVAFEVEKDAKDFAEQVIKGALFKVSANNELCKDLDKEKEKLEGELSLYSHFLAELNVLQNSDTNSRVFGKPKPELVSLDSKELSQKNSTVFSIKLVTFLNAKHFVSFGTQKGPIHAHSWQIQIDAHVPSEKEELIAFAKVLDLVKKTIVFYENKVLNDEYPFQQIHPTTENISLYFYNLLEDALEEVGLRLSKVTVWETPTRGIEVTSRYNEFDIILSREDQENNASFQSHQTLSPEKEAFQEAAVAEEAVSNVESEEKSTLPKPKPKNRDKWLHFFKQPFLGIALILVGLIGAIYCRGIIFSGSNNITWNSSSITYLYQAENLYKSLRSGNLVPLFTENWSIGTNITYTLTLPYYLLAIFRLFSSDIFIAGKYYLTVCILVGAFSWLLWARNVGLWQSVILSMIWLGLVDNVGFLTQGNLPLVFMINIIPSLLISGLSLLFRKQTIPSLLAKILFLQVIALSDPRMAVIFGFFLAFAFILVWLCRGSSFLITIKGIFFYFIGLMTAAWWLMPVVPKIFFNRTLQGSLEYLGGVLPANFHYSEGSNVYTHWEIMIVGAVLVHLLTWRSKPNWAKGLAVVGVIFSLFTLPIMQTIYLKLPWSQTVSPSDFSGFAAVALLGSIATFQSENQGNGFLDQKRRLEFFKLIIFSVLLINSLFSCSERGNVSKNVTNISQISPEDTQVWRQAYVDLSPTDSLITSFLLANGLGNSGLSWIWQGGVTSKQLTLQNHELELQYYPYLMRTSLLHGITSLMIKKDTIMKSDDLSSAAHQAGYQLVSDQGNVSLWEGFEQPYMTEKKVDALFIGKQAGLLALRFPEAEVGYSNDLDDYTLDYLRKYPLIVLSGAEWHVQSRAEKLAVEYAQSGGRLIVDLAGVPKSILSKQPKFLNVYGEPVVLPDFLTVFGQRTTVYVPERLSPESDYSSFVPMGLDRVEWGFDYYGNKAAAFGYKTIDGAHIGFLGANLTRLAVFSGDNSALNLVQKIFNLPIDYKPGTIVPLTNFQILPEGYEMNYQLGRVLTAIVPVPNLEGTRVFIDGMPISKEVFEDLVQIKLPAGRHTIKITYPSSLFKVQDFGVSLLAFLLVCAGYLIQKGTICVIKEDERSMTK